MSSSGEKWSNEGLRAWKEEIMSQRMEVNVSEPQTEGGYLRKFTTYLVRTEPNGFSVRRRFSDFEWLYNSLMERYIGMLIPPLPEKKIGGGLMGSYSSSAVDRNFVKSRMRALGLFMDQLLTGHTAPFVRADPCMMAFISIQGLKEWEAAKADMFQVDAKGGTKGTATESEGITKWKEAIKTFEPPDNKERVMQDVKAQLEPMDKFMPLLIASAKRLAEKAIVYAEEMDEMKKAWAQWGAHEKKCGDPSRVEYANKHSDTMNQQIAECTTLFGQWGEILKFQPAINELILYEGVKFQYQLCCALRNLLKNRDNMMAALTRAEANLVAKEKKYQSVDSQSPQAEKAKKEWEDEKIKVATQRENIDLLTRGLFFSELDQFNMDKSAMLMEMMGQMSASHFQYAKRLGLMWTNFMKTMEFDSAQMMEKAKVVLVTSATADSGNDDGSVTE